MSPDTKYFPYVEGRTLTLQRLTISQIEECHSFEYFIWMMFNKARVGGVLLAVLIGCTPAPPPGGQSAAMTLEEATSWTSNARRDYKRVAEAHIESGWAPKDTRVDEFEAAIRAVCEPIFDRPLKDISFGKVLLRLFQTSRRFNVEIQPQLVMLQKTLLNIEGLGRQLDPNLDLWTTAKPFLERWMSEQIGWRGLIRTFKQEAPYLARALPQLPRLVHQALAQPAKLDLHPQLDRLIAAQQQQNRWLAIIALLLALLVGALFI